MAWARDALTVLSEDHRRVRELFREFRARAGEPSDDGARLLRHIASELAVHTYIEEQVLYPRLRTAGRALGDAVLEGVEEHHVVKVLLVELSEMSPHDERFAAKVNVLAEEVDHHIDEEEGDMFAHARRALSGDELVELGAVLAAARVAAPLTVHAYALHELGAPAWRAP